MHLFRFLIRIFGTHEGIVKIFALLKKLLAIVAKLLFVTVKICLLSLHFLKEWNKKNRFYPAFNNFNSHPISFGLQTKIFADFLHPATTH